MIIKIVDEFKWFLETAIQKNQFFFFVIYVLMLLKGFYERFRACCKRCIIEQNKYKLLIFLMIYIYILVVSKL